MLITPSNLNLFFTALETRFWQAYTAAPVVYNRISTTFPVATEQWISGWIGMLDKMREWNGPRVVHTPAPQTYAVAMQLFELTYGVDEIKLRNDTYGIYNPLVDFMGVQMGKWPDYQFRDLLQNQGSQTGSRQLSLDNLTHWNTAHPIDFYDASKGTYANDYTNGGVTTNGIVIGGALAPNSFATVWEDMGRRKAESGESQGVVADLTMVPLMLKFATDTILQAQFMGMPVIGSIGTGAGGTPNAPLVGTTENQAKGWTDRLVWNDLGGSTAVGGGTYDNVWYMLDTSKPVKPLSWLLNMAPDFVYRNQPQDPTVFDTHTYQYGSKAYGAPAWSFSWLASRSGP
jgi:phage major head subunit gpT-like protein